MLIPEKLQKGDEIRVISPSISMSNLSNSIIDLAKVNLEKQGFKVTFSKNCNVLNLFKSSSVEERIADIHEAFSNKNVKAIFSVIGGFNCNQLLSYLDYDLIKRNPKILCGYSDITALLNAITAKTNLLTYSGLHFSTWAMQKEFDYNLEYFNKCLISDKAYIVRPSKTWSDDVWYEDQNDRVTLKNKEYIIINAGNAEGKVFGGNLCTFNLLQGTEFMPNISGSILFLEDDAIVGVETAQEFDRNLQSLIHQTNFDKVRGLVIGRFQKDAEVSIEKLKHIVQSKKELRNIPIIANADFGHTNPMFTIPIGGVIKLLVGDSVQLKILEH